jgi:hypothetical protein
MSKQSYKIYCLAYDQFILFFNSRPYTNILAVRFRMISLFCRFWLQIWNVIVQHFFYAHTVIPWTQNYPSSFKYNEHICKFMFKIVNFPAVICFLIFRQICKFSNNSHTFKNRINRIWYYMWLEIISTNVFKIIILCVLCKINYT